MKTLVESSRAVRFSIAGREALYKLVGRVLKAQRYAELAREQRGIVRRFLAKVTGRSRAQITRLIGQWMETRTIEAKRPARHRFPTRYTETDARLLAEVDAAHDELAGPAVKRILSREYEVFGHPEFAQLAEISVSHLYNLRQSQAYRRVRVRVEHTRPSRKVNIGERRRPRPLGRPGLLRLDTAQQGPRTAEPGCITSVWWTRSHSGRWWGAWKPFANSTCCRVLEGMLHQFPSLIRGFDCDNGSEFINYQVAGLVGETAGGVHQIAGISDDEQRAVEGKNAVVIRQHKGTERLRRSTPKPCRSSSRCT